MQLSFTLAVSGVAESSLTLFRTWVVTFLLNCMKCGKRLHKSKTQWSCFKTWNSRTNMNIKKRETYNICANDKVKRRMNSLYMFHISPVQFSYMNRTKWICKILFDIRQNVLLQVPSSSAFCWFPICELTNCYTENNLCRVKIQPICYTWHLHDFFHNGMQMKETRAVKENLWLHINLEDIRFK